MPTWTSFAFSRIRIDHFQLKGQFVTQRKWESNGVSEVAQLAFRESSDGSTLPICLRYHGIEGDYVRSPSLNPKFRALAGNLQAARFSDGSLLSCAMLKHA